MFICSACLKSVHTYGSFVSGVRHSNQVIDAPQNLQIACWHTSRIKCCNFCQLQSAYQFGHLNPRFGSLHHFHQHFLESFLIYLHLCFILFLTQTCFFLSGWQLELGGISQAALLLSPFKDSASTDDMW